MAKYRSTFSSGEKKLSVANETVDFQNEVYPFNNTNVQFLHIQSFAQECRIKINDEDTIHWIDANSEFILTDIQIDKFTILDANVEYYYTALSE